MEKSKNVEFLCAEHEMLPHVQAVLNGEYEPFITFSCDKSAVFCDIGACYGSFVFWSALIKKWEVKYHCYEPNPKVIEVLTKNINMIKKEGISVEIFNKAVIGNDREEKTLMLYSGKYNIGEASVNPKIVETLYGKLDVNDTLSEIDHVEVSTIKVSDLGNPILVKIDTEGCEVEIIESFLEKEIPPKIFMAEYHSSSDRDKIYELLMEKYTKIAERGRIDTGIVIYSRDYVKYP